MEHDDCPLITSVTVDYHSITHIGNVAFQNDRKTKNCFINGT